MKLDSTLEPFMASLKVAVTAAVISTFPASSTGVVPVTSGGTSGTAAMVVKLHTTSAARLTGGVEVSAAAVVMVAVKVVSGSSRRSGVKVRVPPE